MRLPARLVRWQGDDRQFARCSLSGRNSIGAEERVPEDLHGMEGQDEKKINELYKLLS